MLTDSRLVLGALWLLLASSSIVLVEPAPFDAISVGLLLTLPALGLRLPTGIGTPAVLLGLYLLGNVIAAIGTENPYETFKPLWIRTFLVLTWVLLTCLISESPRRVVSVILSGWLVAALATLAFGFVGYSGLSPAIAEAALMYGRVRGTFKDPNVYGPFLVPVTIASLAWLETTSGVRRLGAGVFFLLAVLGLLLSYSRGAWIDLAIAMGVYLGLRLLTETSMRRRGRLMAFSAILVVVATSTVGWVITNTTAGDLFFARASVAHAYDVEGEHARFAAQRRAVELSLTEPAGVGPSQSPRILGLAPHNLYLHVLSETGWIGGFAFFTFIVLTLVNGVRSCSRASAVQIYSTVVFASLVGLLAQSLFIDTTHWRHLFVLLALVWGCALARPASEPGGAGSRPGRGR